MNSTDTPQGAATSHITNIANFDCVAYCVIKTALEKLNDCRARCPGIGGDIDAMNLRYMLNGEISQTALLQAAKTLDSFSKSLEIPAEIEVKALRSIASEIQP